MEFSYYLPAWLADDKMPISWRHFVYGMNYIRRMTSRKVLFASDAARMAQVEPKDYRAWRKDHENIARY